MTIEETGILMDVLKVAYPQYYKNVSDNEKYNASCLWAEMFSSEDVRIVVAAVKAFIVTDTKGFPPVIGQIKEHISKLTRGHEKSEMEAWNEVRGALCNGIYGAAQAFEALCPIAKRIVGSPARLREMALMDSDEVNTVIASNFQRSYRAISTQEREYSKLPPDILMLVSGIANMKNIEAI